MHHLSARGLTWPADAVYKLRMSGPGAELVPSRMPRSHQVVLSVYLAGCAAWLVLGVLPTLAQLLPPLERAMQTVATGGGPLAVYAERVLAGAMAPQPLGAWALAYLFSGLNLALGLLLIIKRLRASVRRRRKRVGLRASRTRPAPVSMT